MITGRPKYGVGLMCGRLWILLEGGYYLSQQRRLCGYNSRAGTIQRAETIQGNTVVLLQAMNKEMTFHKLFLLKAHC